MTAKLGSAIATKTIQRMNGPSGVNHGLAALSAADGAPVPRLETDQVRAQNAAPDLAERAGSTKYPTISVYCEKLANSQAEKFRSFSGTARMTVEVRHSQDRLDGLQDMLDLCTDAVTQSLSSSRGDWGDGIFYGGGYEVAFGAVKQGGKNFIQAAKITFEVGVSRS